MKKTEYRIPRLSKEATTITTRDGTVVPIRPYGGFATGQLNGAQHRHLDPNDDFSVYDDMDVTIILDKGTDKERTQLIKVPAPANQWRYWHRRMKGERS